MDKIITQKEKCKFCGGTGLHDHKNFERMLVYGMDFREIKKVWDYARSRGYEKEIKTEHQQVKEEGRF